MQEDRREMKLGAVLLPTGGHIAAWRHPDVDPSGNAQLSHYIEAAQTAERGLLDFIFLADSSAVRGSGNLPAIRRQAHGIGFEPLTLLSAIAAMTRNIGLVATTSTSFYQPYRVARQFASLDLISAGRAGWNLVTSTEDVEAQNFGMDIIFDHDERYARAEEFADVVLGLWESWKQDAFVRDKDSGVYFDPDKVRIFNHKGRYYSVRGPLNVPRSPQGRPVIVQAGSSEPGRELAARTTEVVFTAQTELASAQEFYADLKGRLGKYGRRPGEMTIVPGLTPIIGSTEEEAQRKLTELNALIPIDVAVSFVSTIMGGFDLSKYPLDDSLPFGEIPETDGPKSRQKLLIEKARNEGLSIRQLALSAAQNYGHGQVIGTPEQIADRMENWFRSEACDGFVLSPAVLPHSLNDIVDHLVPELQRRGLFRRAYKGRTLRENLR